MHMKKVLWSYSDIPTIQEALEQGRVVVGTSDTVYGLLASPTQKGFDALNTIKGRSEKPYLLITGSVEKALSLCAQDDQQKLRICMEALWPGPITLIVRAKESVPKYMCSKDGTIALRIPAHEGFQLLLEKIPYLFSTSANLTGHPVPHCAQDVDQAILNECALIVMDAKEDKVATVPSTIIDCTHEPFKIVREGAMDISSLKNKCKDLF